MKTTGIIAEYNPFHNGHKYHLEKAKELTDCDYLIIVMSGDYTQRGTPAIYSKYIRAKAALLAGADLVLEMPVYGSVAHALKNETITIDNKTFFIYFLLLKGYYSYL